VVSPAPPRPGTHAYQSAEKAALGEDLEEGHDEGNVVVLAADVLLLNDRRQTNRQQLSS
jgi:hypothetical protein